MHYYLKTKSFMGPSETAAGEQVKTKPHTLIKWVLPSGKARKEEETEHHEIFTVF